MDYRLKEQETVVQKKKRSHSLTTWRKPVDMLLVLEKQILDIKETIQVINAICGQRCTATDWASHSNQHYCAKSKTVHQDKSVEAVC